ncbi:MAG: sensor histidine kinase [Acidimicrobiales bacterium]
MRERTWDLRSLLGSVRVRITLAALVVVAVTLAIGGTALVWQLHRSLESNLAASTSRESTEIARQVSEGSLHELSEVHPDLAIQVVDAQGNVVVQTANLSVHRQVSGQRPPVGDQAVVPTGVVVHGADDPGLTVATTVATRGGPVTVYVVASTESIEDSTHDVALPLAIVLPLLAVLAGAFAWILAGRALQPVEAIRAEVAEISGGDLHRRVPEPGFDDEISRLAATMNAMLERIEAANEAQRRFISDAAHELRSPLAGLLAQVDVARTHPNVADWTVVADHVIEDGTRLQRVVDDLLLLARSDEGHLVAGHDPVDLDELVLDEGQRMVARGRVAVDLRQVSAARVVGDREQLRRVVRNLVENAERHAASGVTLGLRRHGETVELVVADDGPGIPADQRAHIFERFARLDASRGRPTGGTGLGLAIVGEVVAAHDGWVQVADARPGTRMIVRLPADPEAVGDQWPAGGERTPEDAVAPDQRVPRPAQAEGPWAPPVPPGRGRGG